MDYFSTLLGSRKSSPKKRSPTKKKSPKSPAYKPLDLKVQSDNLKKLLESRKSTKSKRTTKQKSPVINKNAILKARENYAQSRPNASLKRK